MEETVQYELGLRSVAASGNNNLLVSPGGNLVIPIQPVKLKVVTDANHGDTPCYAGRLTLYINNVEYQYYTRGGNVVTGDYHASVKSSDIHAWDIGMHLYNLWIRGETSVEMSVYAGVDVELPEVPEGESFYYDPSKLQLIVRWGDQLISTPFCYICSQNYTQYLAGKIKLDLNARTLQIISSCDGSEPPERCTIDGYDNPPDPEAELTDIYLIKGNEPTDEIEWLVNLANLETDPFGNILDVQVYYLPANVPTDQKGLTWKVLTGDGSGVSDIVTVETDARPGKAKITAVATGECIVEARSTYKDRLSVRVKITVLNETYLTAPYAWCAVDGSGEMVYTEERSPDSGDAIWDRVDVTIPDGTVNSHLVSGGINAEYVRFLEIVHNYCHNCHLAPFFWRNPENDNPEAWMTTAAVLATPINVPEGDASYKQLYVSSDAPGRDGEYSMGVGCNDEFGADVPVWLYKDALPFDSTATAETIKDYLADDMRIQDVEWLTSQEGFTGTVYNGHVVWRIKSWVTRPGSWEGTVFEPSGDWTTQPAYGYAVVRDTFQVHRGPEDWELSGQEYATWVHAVSYPQGIDIYCDLTAWDNNTWAREIGVSTLKPIAGNDTHGIYPKIEQSQINLSRPISIFEYQGVLYSTNYGWGTVKYTKVGHLGTVAWTASNCGKSLPEVSGNTFCRNEASFNNTTKYTFANYSRFHEELDRNGNIRYDGYTGAHYGFYERGTGTAKIVDNNGKEYWFSHQEDVEEAVETITVMDEEFE